MSKNEIWIDQTRCTGCGACLEVCPTGALTLVEGKARLNPAQCQGCEACVQVCPTGALQSVLRPQLVNQRDLVPAPSHLPKVQDKGTPPAPLRDAAIGTVVATGVRLVLQIAPVLARTLTQVLSGALAATRSRSQETPALQSSSRPSSLSRGSSRGGGRQARHRHRGRH